MAQVDLLRATLNGGSADSGGRHLTRQQARLAGLVDAHAAVAVGVDRAHALVRQTPRVASQRKFGAQAASEVQ
jgi:hypothetical protein